ncbi:hypothetical protein EWM64_g9600 [Hericium alpestre]|uniref:Uncharacterized protein n=1 Tax=Hericium alpestre TaxID=135208 RepID=A0A4Y9ZID0_9AGAM|nr:hypothetical protein EWM64_g9600 [Hericium alpestre]
MPDPDGTLPESDLDSVVSSLSFFPFQLDPADCDPSSLATIVDSVFRCAYAEEFDKTVEGDTSTCKRIFSFIEKKALQ